MKTPTLLILEVGLTLSLGWSSTAHPATWKSIGPDGGTVSALAFAPSNPQVAYAGTLGGGVFRSGDGGASWTAASFGLKRQDIFSLAVDPRAPEVVYAGTIEGLYKTTSGGASWGLLPLGSAEFPPIVDSVLVDPAQPRVLYAVTSNGIFRSADSGAHWTERDAGLPGSISNLDLDPDHPGVLYVSALGSDSHVIYKTLDGGGSWTPLPGLQADYVNALGHQRSTGTLYVATSHGLFTTQDGGATWLQASRDILSRFVVAPSGTLYASAGSGIVVMSVDGGKTWSRPDDPSSPYVQPYGDVLTIALDPSGDHLFTAGFGTGVYSLKAGGVWTDASRGIRATGISGLAVSPRNPSLLFAATYGRGVFVSADGGASFVARNAGFPLIDGAEIDVRGLATNPRAPGSLVVGLDFGSGLVEQTSNAGRGWVAKAPLCLPADTFAWAPPNTLFVSESSPRSFGGFDCSPGDCLAKVSRDGGATFACLDGPQDVSAFLVDPLRPIVIYAAAGDAIWKSTDRGVHFTQVASGLGMTITSLAASPAAHQTLYAGGDKGVLKSTDGGTSWFPAGAGLPGPISALLADPTNPSLIYAASPITGFFGVGTGVYESLGGGASWSLLGNGFPAIDATSLALDPSRHVLYAGTRGNGVWALTLP